MNLNLAPFCYFSTCSISSFPPLFAHLFLDYFLDFISTIGLLVIALYQRKKRKKFEWFLLGFPIYILLACHSLPSKYYTTRCIVVRISTLPICLQFFSSIIHAIVMHFNVHSKPENTLLFLLLLTILLKQ